MNPDDLASFLIGLGLALAIGWVLLNLVYSLA
jgi:hypothetical protein